ncbi:hypothetical protein [Pseudactinotalea sp.]|uniref:hypothetical protein n=1 Tax=Pseudactinotalea sp. TaxID=1926260 RepID=UPI003B3B4C77
MGEAREYTVTTGSEFIQGDAELDDTGRTWPDGTPLTEATTEAYTVAQRRRGRPSLSGEGRPSPQVAFRVPEHVRARAEAVAASEGRSISALARAALEEYLAARSA